MSLVEMFCDVDDFCWMKYRRMEYQENSTFSLYKFSMIKSTIIHDFLQCPKGHEIMQDCSLLIKSLR